MKYLFIFFVCITLQASAQNQLNFNKGFMESLNKWVALKTGADTIYAYGFIYMDVNAGLTAREGGLFKIKDNVFVGHKNLPYQIQLQRLHDDGRIKVAWIPDEKVKELQEEIEPSWLKGYKVDTASVSYLFRMGFSYNAGNQTNKALYYLNRVKKADPNYNGLAFEYIYAYNGTKQFDKAEAIIMEQLKKTPKDGSLYKELVFAQLGAGKMPQAEDSFKQASTFCGISLKTEMAYNITYTYFSQKNKEKFNTWANDMQSWVPATDTRTLSRLAQMKQMLN
jgi:tetratricopeptide (TPR) repeat protein